MNPFLTLHLLLVGKVLTAGWRGNITGPSSSKSVHLLKLSLGCWQSFVSQLMLLLSPACDTHSQEHRLQWRAKLLRDVQLLESQALHERHRDTSPQVQGGLADEKMTCSLLHSQSLDK